MSSSKATLRNHRTCPRTPSRTDDERVQFILENRDKLPVSVIAKNLGISHASYYNILKRNGYQIEPLPKKTLEGGNVQDGNPATEPGKVEAEIRALYTQVNKQFGGRRFIVTPRDQSQAD